MDPRYPRHLLQGFQGCKGSFDFCCLGSPECLRSENPCELFVILGPTSQPIQLWTEKQASPGALPASRKPRAEWERGARDTCMPTGLFEDYGQYFLTAPPPTWNMHRGKLVLLDLGLLPKIDQDTMRLRDQISGHPR